MRDIACDHADPDAGRFYQIVDQFRHARIQQSFFPIDLGQGVKQFFSDTLAHVLSQIAWEFLDATYVFEKLAAFLESVQIADVHSVMREGNANCRESINECAVGVKNDQAIRASIHAFSGRGEPY